VFGIHCSSWLEKSWGKTLAGKLFDSATANIHCVYVCVVVARPEQLQSKIENCFKNFIDETFPFGAHRGSAFAFCLR
jgi:hypothetical protein